MAAMLPAPGVGSGLGCPGPGLFPGPPSSSSSSSAFPPLAAFDLVPPWLAENPYFSAGFGLASLGVAASFLRSSAQTLSAVARRRLFTSLEIPIHDESYRWVMQWLIQKGRMTNHLGIATTYVKDGAGNPVVHFDFIPSPGRHFLWFRRTLCVVDRTRDGQVVDMKSGRPWETLKLETTIWNRQALRELIGEARDSALSKEEGKTVIFRSTGQRWEPYGEPRTIRPFQSVILAEGVAESVLEDILEFLSSQQWYLERGIPYRRGYLLHGPPGCGKSSFVTALAGKLKYNICVMNVADPFMTEDRLQYLLA
eukprot:GHVT01081649.1.p1 GENE.GHVT01081649.1~~GHVT01081649.1.p1  ORF type:complete len:310 (+),score=59.55 GHVT01081649.1:34-963(+)